MSLPSSGVKPPWRVENADPGGCEGLKGATTTRSLGNRGYVLSCSLPAVCDPDGVFSPLRARLPRKVLERPPPQLRVLRPRAPRRPVRLELVDHERLLEQGEQVLPQKTRRMLDGTHMGIINISMSYGARL